MRTARGLSAPWGRGLPASTWSPAPRHPPAEAGGIILEVNGTPNLYFHYHKHDGCFPSAVHALTRLLLAGDATPHAPFERPNGQQKEASKVLENV